MIVQPKHKLLFLAAVLLGADPCAVPALLAELPSPTFSQIKQLHILTSGMQQRQVWFMVLYTVTLATCRLCQHICDWDSCLHTPTSDTFSVRRCAEHVSDPT